MSVPGYHLGAKLPHPFGESLYQFGFGLLAGVRGAQGIDSPALRLTVCHQGTDADDFVQRVFWKARPQTFPHFGFRGRAQIKHSGCGCDVRHYFKVPGNDCLFGHGCTVAQSPLPKGDGN
jgi:hypothetical protein